MDVLIHEAADKVLKKLDQKTQARIKQRLKLLAQNPYSAQIDVVKLKIGGNGPDLFRLRVGDFRVIYSIHQNQILITDIKRREQAYG